MENIPASTAHSVPETAIWMTAAATLLLLATCVFFSARAESKAGKYGWLAAFLVLLGSMPIWVTIVFLAFKHELLLVGPFILLIMVIWHLSYSITAAAFVAVAYAVFPGRHSRKLTCAAAFGLLAAGGLALRVNNDDEARRKAQAEGEAAEAFVRGAPEVTNELEPPVFAQVLIHPTLTRPANAAPEMDYRLVVRSGSDSTREMFVVVDVSRRGGEPEFRIGCVVPDGKQAEAPKPCSRPSSP